jgi:hypothetical protein
MVLDDLHAGEELSEVRGDELLDRKEPAAAGTTVLGGSHHAGATGRDDGDEPGHIVGHLDPGEQFRAALRIPYDDSEVQGETRDVREWVRRVDGQGSEDGEDLVAEVRAKPPSLGGVEVGPPDELDLLLGQRRPNIPREAAGVAGDEDGGPFGDELELLPGRQARLALDRKAGMEPALEAGHADHIELVEVAGEDREELGALQQRGVGILGEGQHPGVEVQPGQFAVQIPVVRQWHQLRRIVQTMINQRPGLGGRPGLTVWLTVRCGLTAGLTVWLRLSLCLHLSRLHLSLSVTPDGIRGLDLRLSLRVSRRFGLRHGGGPDVGADLGLPGTGGGRPSPAGLTLAAGPV